MYDSVDGSARLINLTVSDGNNRNCDSATSLTISPESCNVDGVCKHHSRKICSTTSSTNVAVYVSNVLGNGISTTQRIGKSYYDHAINSADNILADNQNKFVTINFDNDRKSVRCTFLNPSLMLNDQKTCMISIGSGQNNMVTRSGSLISKDTVSINLNGLLESMDEMLSYMITASNGTHQVVVVDDLELRPRPVTSDNDSTGGIVAGILILVGLATVALIIAAIIVYCYWVSLQLTFC